MKKMVVTGSNGLLGQKLVKLCLAKGNFEIHALSKGENRQHNKKGYTYYNIDVTQKKELQSIIRKIEPNYIIHTAAMTNVDACESNKETCDLINVQAVKYLVEVCEELNTHLIHISTDFIFDGKKGSNYNEEDAPNPLSYYGLSKLKSENLLKNSGIKYTILRTILVFGLVDNMDRSNIVLWVKHALENKKQINVITDQYRMPTLVDDLAKACLLVVDKDALGVYNISSNTLFNIYEIALLIADCFGLDKKYINPVQTSDLNLPAKRPFKTGFNLNKSISQLNFSSASFKDRLQVFKNQLDRVESV